MIPDLTLIHAPSVIDFRSRPTLYGPISDGIPSTSIFEMYPIGFTILADYLRRFGYKTRIVNLALQMLTNPELDLEKFLGSLKTKVFGIDLHWLPHVQGSLECARLLKKLHPDIPVIFGGLSSTYFHEDIIKYPQVDGVMRGDSTEEPVLKLVQVINKGGSLDEVPNLTWKKPSGEVVINPFSYVPENLDHINIDYRQIVKDTLSYRDPSGYIPYHNWVSYPATGVLSCRGCANNCITCGGSAFATKTNCNREAPIYRNVELLANDILKIQGLIKSPIFIFGDMTHLGEENALTLFDLIRPARLHNEIIFEFFKPPSREFLKAAISSTPNISIEISPETHDEYARMQMGKPFTNRELEDMIASAIEYGCRRIDIFFMVGLRHQTPESVRETVRYTAYLLERFGKNKVLFPYIDPLAPFIDPASNVNDNPEAFGYRLLATKLEEYRHMMQAPSWKYMLNYETAWMDRHQIVDSTYESAREFNWLKRKYGIIPQKLANWIDQRIEWERNQIEQIDHIWSRAGGEYAPEDYQHLGLHWQEMLYNKSTCGNNELERTIWLFRYIPFPKLAQRLLLKLWQWSLRLLNKNYNKVCIIPATAKKTA